MVSGCARFLLYFQFWILKPCYVYSCVVLLLKEARGLDAGPRLVQKLIGFGDHRTSKIVAKIADEEVAHVAVGVFWFLSVCEKMGRTPCTTFRGQFILSVLFRCSHFLPSLANLPISFTDLLEEYNVEVKGPFNHLAREEAGLPRDW